MKKVVHLSPFLLGSLLCAGCVKLLTPVVAPSTYRAHKEAMAQQPGNLEQKKIALQQMDYAQSFVRVEAPSPKPVQNTWEPGSPIAAGTPEYCVQKFIEAMKTEDEGVITEALDKTLVNAEHLPQLRSNATGIVTLFRSAKTTGAKIEEKLLGARRGENGSAVVDAEFVSTHYGNSHVFKQTFLCQLVNGEWKICNLVEPTSSAQICRTRMDMIGSMFSSSIFHAAYAGELEAYLQILAQCGRGKEDSTIVATLYEYDNKYRNALLNRSKGTKKPVKKTEEPKCEFAGGKPYILDFDVPKRTYSVRCPCADLHPTHFLPAEE